MIAPDKSVSLVDAKQSAKAFIMQHAERVPIKFEHVKDGCCKYGITGMKEPAREELGKALATSRDFDTGYFSDSKEPYSWRLYRDDGVLGLEASAFMDDPDELIDTAVWEAYGKNKNAGSGHEAAMRKWKFTDEQAENWMRALVQAIDIQSEANEYHEFKANDPGQHDLDTVLNTLNELDALCSGTLESEYRKLITFVRDEGRHYAAVIKARRYVAKDWPGLLPDADDFAQAENDEALEPSKAGALVRALLEDVYKLSSTQINLPSPLDDFVVKWGRMNVPDDSLYYDEDGGCGRETEPHITVLYGLTDGEPTPELLDLLRRTKPFTVRLGPLSLFKNEKYDVLKFSVVSDDLVDLANALKAACPNENEYPEYIPHCTVAYCKKGTVDHMEGVYPFEADPPIPNEFEAWELWFKGAGDSEDPNRVVKPIEFGGRYREEGKAKDFILGKARFAPGTRVRAPHPLVGIQPGVVVSSYPSSQIAMVRWDCEPGYQGTVRFDRLLPEAKAFIKSLKPPSIGKPTAFGALPVGTPFRTFHVDSYLKIEPDADGNNARDAHGLLYSFWPTQRVYPNKWTQDTIKAYLYGGIKTEAKDQLIKLHAAELERQQRALKEFGERWTLVKSSGDSALYRNNGSGVYFKLLRDFPDDPGFNLYTYAKGGSFIDGMVDAVQGASFEPVLLEAEKIALAMIKAYSSSMYRNSIKPETLAEGAAKDFIKSHPGSMWSYQVERDYNASDVRESKAPGNLDDAVSTSIGQALPFRLVPVGASFIHDGRLMLRQDSESRAWNWFRGGYAPIGENEIVKPVSHNFSPFDRLPFPEETSVLKGKLRRR